MAQVALLGATGNAGSRILKELSDRGHQVTALARSIGKLPTLPGVTAKAVDVKDQAATVAALRGHEVVMSALPFDGTDGVALIEAVRAAGAKRYLVVGGAGSLLVDGNTRVFDLPQFPAEYKAEAGAGIAYLALLKQQPDLDWTFLSPQAYFVPGERTGKFRLGKDELLSRDGDSRISFEDYAIAMVDEVETPKHVRERFTVGY